MGDAVGVGTGVQVGGRADNAVDWGGKSVADSWGCGAGLCSKPHAAPNAITKTSDDVIRILFIG